MKKYIDIEQLGSGKFGTVYQARNSATGNLVALKIMDCGNAAKKHFQREMAVLELMKKNPHKNIVEFQEVWTESVNRLTQRFIVLEICDCNLNSLLRDKSVSLCLNDIKKIAYELLQGLKHLHYHKIMHLDIKPENILITEKGTLKIADFGLSRTQGLKDKSGRLIEQNHMVVTIWYRPAELILGKKDYGVEVDMWSAGCVIAELCTRVPLMTGTDEKLQLERIVDLCGAITPQSFPAVETLKGYQSWYKNILNEGSSKERRLKRSRELKGVDQFAIDLIDKLLILDPSMRLMAGDALDHDFFLTEPKYFNRSN